MVMPTTPVGPMSAAWSIWSSVRSPRDSRSSACVPSGCRHTNACEVSNQSRSAGLAISYSAMFTSSKVTSWFAARSAACT